MHPIPLVLCVIGIGSSILRYGEFFPWLTPALMAASFVGLAARAFVLRRDAELDAGRVGIDFAALRRIDALRLEPWLKENVRGQDETITAVSRSLQKGLALAGPGRTLGAFLLVGPTGTGKTFLAELIAQALFPASEPLILRMNQFKEPSDVSTLLGPPPGQQGYQVGGALTRPVLEQPLRVIVLDEIDKCHLDVQHCLYNVLDGASCREKSSGKTVSFAGCAIFATCNTGVEALRRIQAGRGSEAERIGRSRDALGAEAGFERAFLARFDGVYLMDELKPLGIAEVACLQLARHWRQYGIEVSYASPEVLLQAMRENAEFKEYGVRQLAHLIQRQTDASIEEARRQGVVRVRLGFDPALKRISIEALS